MYFQIKIRCMHSVLGDVCDLNEEIIFYTSLSQISIVQSSHLERDSSIRNLYNIEKY